MTSLMKFLAITAAVLFTTTNAANAWYSTGANSSSVGSITVKLYDDAENACWTNLREAREYAEEKLNIEGYNVLAEGGEYNFQINVLGKRHNSGGCFGYVRVSIWASNYRNGVLGGHEIGAESSVYVNHDNLNNAVIEVISWMVAEM
jgi:predicted butyrate kinase (DUF1464 family)